jgi:hypothetical protein
MMSKTGLILPDSHTQKGQHNRRFDLVSSLLYDLRPDFFVNIGDHWDMPSLCKYDQNKKEEFSERRYQTDIAVGIEANDRIFHSLKKNKKKLPLRIFCEGNHEHRIVRALLSNPVLLEGTLGIKDLQLDKSYDIINLYDGDTPSIYELEDILIAHYIVSGTMGNPIGGEAPANSLLVKKHRSCIVGHDHRFDHSVKAVGSATGKSQKTIMGLFAGCFIDFRPSFAGQAADLWQSGMCILHGVEKGTYDIEWVSLQRLKQIYR